MRKLTNLAALAAVTAAAAAAAQPPFGHGQRSAPSEAGRLILFEASGYGGDMLEIDSARTQVRTPWNIGSLAVHPGERWQICARPRYQEPCIVLDRSVQDASAIGISGQIGSARPAPADADN